MNKVEKLKMKEMSFIDELNNSKEENSIKFTDSLDLFSSLNVINKENGKIGYVRSYDNKSIQFIVTSEGNREYIYSNEEFEENFIEIEDELLQFVDFTKEVKFLVFNDSVYLVKKITQKDDTAELELISKEGTQLQTFIKIEDFDSNKTVLFK